MSGSPAASRSTSGLSVLALLLLAACADAAGPPPPATPATALAVTTHDVTACGTIIATSGTYALATDLLGCPGTAIEIAADSVTLELRGHTLRGVGQGFGIGVGTGTYGPVTGVRVTGPGTVDHFYVGVHTEHMIGSTITGLLIQHNEHGLTLNRSGAGDGAFSSGDSLVRNHLVDNLHHGISLNGATASVLLGNRATGNGAAPFNGFGIYLYLATDIEVRRNETVNNAQLGIVVEGGQLGNQIVDNVARRNRAGDLLDHNCAGNLWLGNRYDRRLVAPGCGAAPR